MKVLIVRHAIAEDRAPSGLDQDRQLTSKGRELFTQLAEFLLRQEIVPQRILHSRLVRAVQTAAILAEVTDVPEKHVQQNDVINPGISLEDLSRQLQELGNQGINLVACVGHEPDMSRITSQYIGGGAIKFPKGGVACIDFGSTPHAGTGVLRWFISPKLIRED